MKLRLLLAPTRGGLKSSGGDVHGEPFGKQWVL